MGKDYEIKNVGGAPGGEAFLITTANEAALIDAGFAYCAPQMIQNLKNALGTKPLKYIFLTHSHYDHASGSVYCRDVWKDVKTVSTAHAAAILQKPSAHKTMRNLNDAAARLAGVKSYADKLDGLSTDIILEDGDAVCLDGLRLKMLYAPGHTNCSAAFWCADESLLLSCETLGVYAGENFVLPTYLVSYRTTMNFIRRVQALAPDKILIPHFGLLTADACKRFIQNAAYWNEEAMLQVCNGFKEGKTEEELKCAFKERFYTPEVQKIQPEEAFDLNTHFMIPMLIRECTRVSKT